MADPFPNLPGVSFVATDAQQVIADIIDGYEQVAGRSLQTSDPVRLFLLSLAYIIVGQRQQIDASGKSTLLAYARGPFLDHLGAFRRTPRHEATPSITTVRFELSAAQPSAIGIPAGTRVTADGQFYWRTTAPAQIAAGQLFVEVPVAAMIPGEAGNGLQPGEINQLVDPIPFVSKVRNTTITQGGADREDDDTYRVRIYNAPAAFSIAGPSEAYEYWAYTASSAISDVRADTPIPGVARVCVLLQGGEIPDQSVLDAVDAVLSPSDIRPLCDSVQVVAAEAAPYDIAFTYYVRRQDQGSLVQIQERVGQAVQTYIAWQRAKLGRDIDPGELNALVRAAGAKRLAITAPVFTALDRLRVAQEANVSVLYGGVEDE